MYENIVIESCANAIECEKVRRVCAGAAHQIRMIRRALQKQQLIFFTFLFLFRCAPFVLFLSAPLSSSLSPRSPHVPYPTPVLTPGMKPKHDGKCAT